MKMLSNRTGGYLPALILAVMLTIGISAPKVQAQNGYNNNYGDNYYGDNYDSYNNGSYQDFYSDLAPYGQWLNDPQYGYVWTPNVGRDFRPYYTNGYWVMTEYGNMWVSNYNWGWGPFHYGRWAQSSYYGWIWIPGNEWGPAWVNWRQGGGYYGWAPMGPGVSINFSFGSGYNVPNPWWTFIPCGNIYSRSFNRYYAPRRTVNIINNTTIINNTYVDNRTRNTYVTGPRRSDVETATRQRVTVYSVNNGRSAGATSVSGRSVNVYRPQVGSGRAGNNTQAAPRQVKTLERSAVTNPGGGRQPVRAAAVQDRSNTQQVQPAVRGRQPSNATRVERSSDSRAVQQQSQVQQRSAQQRAQQVELQRNTQRQQLQQQNVERQQADQQRNLQRQQLQQQDRQRQQAEQQQNAQRQQMEQQRNVQRQQAEQQQNVQRQQMEQQRSMQRQQAEQQQNAQRQQMEQQRSAERQQVQQQRNVERSQAQPQQRSAPAAAPQRSVERAPRGR